ncbi:MAG: CDP-alcohol phosphatidyltransferase family protein [Sedimentisphaerales bacterium]
MLKQIPNILTFGRLILTVLFLAMLLYSPYAADRTMLIDVAFAIFVIAGLTDIIDGPIARKLKIETKFGRMLDPLVDKVLVCGAFFCFACIGQPEFLFNLSNSAMHIIRWSVAAILIIREGYVTVIRHIAEAKGIDFRAVASGKIKMLIQSFTVGIVLVKAAHVQTATWGHWFTAITFAIMLAVTVISGLTATRRIPQNISTL